jgi:hypothetical protein
MDDQSKSDHVELRGIDDDIREAHEDVEATLAQKQSDKQGLH